MKACWSLLEKNPVHSVTEVWQSLPLTFLMNTNRRYMYSCNYFYLYTVRKFISLNLNLNIHSSPMFVISSSTIKTKQKQKCNLLPLFSKWLFICLFQHPYLSVSISTHGPCYLLNQSYYLSSNLCRIYHLLYHIVIFLEGIIPSR
jgi:hypothetical protein